MQPKRLETILLVEDEPAIRRLISMALTREGYRVLEARTGPEALSVFDEHGDTLDLLISDIRLPYIDGREIIDRLRQRRPTLKVVAISAYPLNAPDDGSVFLAKPFSREDFLNTVRAVLDSQGQTPKS
jgi:two-component system cell cycle sensor histidine kinase/response regulator CckA